jgi:hypothetical protein
MLTIVLVSEIYFVFGILITLVTGAVLILFGIILGTLVTGAVQKYTLSSGNILGIL